MSKKQDKNDLEQLLRTGGEEFRHWSGAELEAHELSGRKARTLRTARNAFKENSWSSWSLAVRQLVSAPALAAGFAVLALAIALQFRMPSPTTQSPQFVKTVAEPLNSGEELVEQYAFFLADFEEEMAVAMSDSFLSLEYESMGFEYESLDFDTDALAVMEDIDVGEEDIEWL